MIASGGVKTGYYSGAKELCFGGIDVLHFAPFSIDDIFFSCQLTKKVGGQLC